MRLWSILLALRSIQHLESTVYDHPVVEVGKSENVWQHSLVVNRNSSSKKNEKLEDPTSSPRNEPEDFQKPGSKTHPGIPERLAELSGCDFGGRRLRVAVSQQPPLVNCIQNIYGDWHCNGSNIEVISLLEHRLNFRAYWVVLTSSHLLQQPRSSASRMSNNLGSPSRAFSQKQPNEGRKYRGFPLSMNEENYDDDDADNYNDGQSMLEANYSGVLAMVASGRAWLSANGVLNTPTRSAHLLLSEPFDSFKFHFLLSKSVRDHDHIFIKPFTSDAWLGIFLSAFLIVPAFYLLNSTSSYYLLKEDPFLTRISLFACFRYRLKQALCAVFCWPCNCWNQRKLNRRKRARTRALAELNGESSTSSSLSSSMSDSFDTQVDRMLASDAIDITSSPSERELIAQELRLRRLMRRQWALERRRARRAGRLNRKSGFFKPAYVAWYVVGSLANQGGEEEDLPASDSTRILVAFWWLYLVVIVSFHSGILTAILTFPKQSDFIQTLDDFLELEPHEKAGLRLWLDRSSELAELLSQEENLRKSPLQALLKESSRNLYPIERVDFQRHRQRVLDEVQAGHGAYLEEKSAINLIITQEYFDQQRKRCLFKSSKHPIGVEPMSLVLSDRLEPQCVRAINYLLSRVQQSGLAQKWRRKYEALGNDCLNTVVINAGDVDKIQFKHVVLAFWVLAAGLITGAILLILEVVWLFTADFDDDDSDDEDSSDDDDVNSDESSSSYALANNRLRLGYRASGLTGPARPLRSLALDSRRKLGLKRAGSGESRARANSGVDTPSSKEKRRGKPVDRRKRLHRTMELVKRLQEGNIYTEFFSKVSGNVQNRARRASHAIVKNLPLSRLRLASGDADAKPPENERETSRNSSTGETSQPGQPIRRRRLRRTSSKVIPSG